MHSFFSWWLILVAFASTACSGGHADDVGGECVTDRQCASGDVCITGRCVGAGTGSAIATAKVAGAPDDVRVATSGDDTECDDRGAKGVVCTLGESEGLTLTAPEVEGYRFTHWSGSPGCEGEAPKLSLAKLKKNVTCTANYVKRVHVRGEVAGEGGIAIVASSDSAFAVCDLGACEVDSGSEVVLLAPARDGFKLTGFDGPGCEQRDGYRVTVATAEDDVSCTASYLSSLTVRGQTSGLGASADQSEGEVKASSSDEGAQCEGPLCAIDPGQTVSLTAPTLDGYRFRGWTGDPACLGSEPTLTLGNVRSNLTCTADYVTRYTVKGESEGATAEISASAENLFSQCGGASCVVDSGEAVTLIAGVVDGYRLDRWTGDGCEPQPGAAVIAANVQSDVRCTAHYVEGVSVSGTLVNATGEIRAESTSSGAKCSDGTCAIDVGGEVTLTAPQLSGRTFLGWSGSEGCTGDDLTLSLSHVTSSKACRATYAARYTVTSAANPSAGGTLTATAIGNNSKCSKASCEVDEGSTVTLTAKTSPKYRFTGWSGGGPCIGFLERLDLPDVQSSVTCTANFALRVAVSGTVSPTGAGTVEASQLSLSADCAGAKCTVDAGSDVSLNASANEGWRFVNWSGCGSFLNPLLSFNPLPVLGVAEDTVCTANFQKLTYPVTALGSTGGTAAASQGSIPCAGGVCQVPYGESATLTALPSDGYDFAGWTGGCSGGASTTVSNVRAAVSCSATFKIKQVTLTGAAGGALFAPAPRGSCGGTRCTVDWGGSASMTAVLDPNQFRFDGWGACPGGSTSGGAREVLTVANLRADQTCVANYTRRNYVTVAVDPQTPHGTARCDGNCWVDPGGSLNVVAEPFSGYNIDHWSCSDGEGVKYESTLAVRPAADLTCTITFGYILY